MGSNLINDALAGERGEIQKLIAETGVSVTELLLKKNMDYGSSAFKRPFLAPHVEPLDAILVRLSDKVERLRNLKNKDAEVVQEAYNDTVLDLIGYFILYFVGQTNEAVLDMADGGST